MLVADDLLLKSLPTALFSVYAGHIYAYAGLVYAGCFIVQTDAKSEAGNSCHKTHYYNLGFAAPNLRLIPLSASFTCDPDMVMIC